MQTLDSREIKLPYPGADQDSYDEIVTADRNTAFYVKDTTYQDGSGATGVLTMVEPANQVGSPVDFKVTVAVVGLRVMLSDKGIVAGPIGNRSSGSLIVYVDPV